MLLTAALTVAAVGGPFEGAKWIGSNPALTPEIDFSQARWVTGRRIRTVVTVGKGDSRELVIAARNPFSLYVNGRPVYEWKGHVFRPEVLRHFNLTPYLNQGENVVALEKAEAALAVVRSGTNIVSSSSGTWHGVDSELDEVPPFAELIDFREELESPAFAKRFVVRDGLCSAKLLVTGLGFYEARLDGKKIGDSVLDPSPTDYGKRILYSTYELDGLAPGEHVLGLVLGHGWYDMRSTATWNFDNAPWRDRPKAIARLVLTYSDGTQKSVATDGTWEQVESPVVYDCIREGEIVDARRQSGRTFGCKAAEVAGPRGTLEPMRHPAARVVERLAPQSIKDLGDGRCLVTFPRTVSGWVRTTFRGLLSGDVVLLRYDENLGPDGGPAIDSRGNWDVAQLNGRRTVDVFFQQSGSGRILPHGSSAQTDHFISAGGDEETFEPRFVYHGFRHVLITGLKSPLEANDIVACRVMTDFAATGSFECSDQTLTELVAMTRNSYMANFADGLPTDCPHREKLAWTGDGWIASEFGLGFFDTASSYRKWMHDIFDTMRPSGEVCCIAPTSGWGYKWGNGPVFDAAVVMVAWNLWTFRGDREALEEAYPYLVRYLAYEKTRETEPGLVANGLGDWNAVDPSHKPTDEYVISCIYLMLQETAGKIADVLGCGRDREMFEKAARQTRAALLRKYYRGGGVFDNGGQTAQALAVTLGLAGNAADASAVADRLVRSVVETGCHVDFGLVGAKFVYRALTEIGRADLAYRMVVNPAEPSMTKWIGGNGTLWEDFGFGFSKCHIMLGDFAAWAQQTIAGIRRPLKPGYAVAVIEPVLVPGLEWAKGNVTTPHGKLSVSWSVAGDEFSIDVEVPSGAHAEVRLPDGGRKTVGEGRHNFKANVGAAKPSAVDPATVWNREELYKIPRTWQNQAPFKGEVTPLWIEGETYRGKPTRLFTFLGIPEGASASRKVPGIVLVHGGAGTAYPEWVRLWTRRGYAAITVDNCGQLPAMGVDGKWIANPDGGPRGWREESAKQVGEPLREQWMYHAIAASVRAHSYLRSLDCVDASNIGVTGISWGGIQTCILAALDDRFAYAVPVYGCGFNSDPGGIMSPELHGPAGEAWGRLWDPSIFLPYAKIPFLWVDGTNDRSFPLDHVMRSAELAKGTSFFCTRLNMVHAHGPAGEGPPEILDFADCFARGGRSPVNIKGTSLHDGKIFCRFDALGRGLAGAELLWTCDAANMENGSRRWERLAIRDFDPMSGEVSAVLPAGAVQAFVNFVDTDGLIFSSPTMKTSSGDTEVSFAERGPLPKRAATLEQKLASGHKMYVSDSWGGGHRIIFDFNGRRAWIVEPKRVSAGVPWVWTMQWMGAYLERTGAPKLVDKGWHHVHLEAYDTRADDDGLKTLADFQEFLVKELGFAEKAGLIGMSWGGFYSVRYASAYPDKVNRIYLDAPLLNVYTLPLNWARTLEERIGSWAMSRPDDIYSDPRQAVNRADVIASAKIPMLLIYGKDDPTVDPKLNSEPFLAAFRKAGGSALVVARDAWGHHPHGLEPDETGKIVEFFEASKHDGDRASFGPLSPSARPCERRYLWPQGHMPDFQAEQIAAKWDLVTRPGFDRSHNQRPYIEWYAPSASNRTDICVLTVSGGGFRMTCDAERLRPAIDRLVAAGITVADVTYRTPRPKGLPIYQTAWEDVQRAVRIVRSEASKRGYSPDKIGATGISAGAKAVLLVATSSQTRAYEPIDDIDAIPANLDFAVLQAAAYVLSDGASGPNERRGDGEDIVIVPELRFDEKTCPMCFLHGGSDAISPLGPTRVFRKLRGMGIPADLHVFADRWHGFHGDQNIGEAGEAYDHWWDRAIDFILPSAEGESFPSEEIPEGLVICNANDPKAVEAIERWENLWRKGVQTNLHIAGSRGPVSWSGRIREYLNRPRR